MYGCGERKMTLIFLVPDCKCAMVKFLEERYTLLLGYDCKTGFATKYWILRQLLTRCSC